MTSELIAVYVQDVEPRPGATLRLSIRVTPERMRIEVGGQPLETSRRRAPALARDAVARRLRIADRRAHGRRLGRRGPRRRDLVRARALSGLSPLGAAGALGDVGVQPRLRLLGLALELAQARRARLARPVAARAVQVAAPPGVARELAQLLGAVALVAHRPMDVTPPTRARYRERAMELAPDRPNVELRRGSGGHADRRARLPVRPAHRRRRARDPRPQLRLGRARVVGARRRLGRGPRRRRARALPRADRERRGRRLARADRAPLGRARHDGAPRRPRLVGARDARRHAARRAARRLRRARRHAARAADRSPAPRRSPTEDNARLDAGANRCVEALLSGEDPPPARLTAARTFDGERLRLDVLWDPEIGAAFGKLPGAEASGRTLPVDPWVVEPLDAFLARHGVAVDGPGPLHARRAARRARRGARPDPPLARDDRRADRRGRGGPRRRARAVSVGGRALRARRAARRSSPTSRGSARPSRRSPRSRPTAPTRRSSSAPRR